MKPCHLLFPLVLTLQLTACSSSDDPASLPADDDDEPVDPPVALETPDYLGELTFASTLQVDLDPMIQAAGLNRVYSYQVSRDGATVRADVLNDDSDVTAIAIVDTQTGEASWLLTDISENTEVLFDAENTPVAVASLACATTSYTATFDDSLFDLATLVPADRCIYKDIETSADGNVALFNTYDPLDLTQYGTPANTTLHAYTLDSANLQDYPDTSLEIDGVTLSPRLSAVSYQGYDLSDDGQFLFSQQWWEGSDASGNTIRQVGATLWNTVSGDWLVRGQAEDLRGCTITDQIDCLPPYSYALSADGNRQYSEIPVGELLENRPPYDNFETAVESTLTGSDTTLPIDNTGTVSAMITNADGDQLVFYSTSASDSDSGGYHLYQHSSDTIISLSRAMKGCPLTDDDGNEVDESECVYNSIPGAITSEAEFYTADGQHVLFRSISRFSDVESQAVDNFLLDVEDAAMYTLPEFHGDRAAWISGDASVIIGVDETLMIGRR